jgi:ACT domain-containing protein
MNLIDTFFNFPNLKNDWDRVYNITDINDELFSLIENNKNNDEKVLVNLSNCHRQLANICSQKLSELFTKERIDQIKNKLVFDGKKYFDDGVNICLHLRTSNPSDIPSEIVSPLREYYVRESEFYRYKNLIEFLKKNTENQKATLHIHSQGFTTNFEEFLGFESNNFSVQLHIDDHPVSDLYHMVNSDLLIMSNSSFSWIASLLNSNQKIVRDNFTNGPFVHNSLKANYDYTEIL